MSRPSLRPLDTKGFLELRRFFPQLQPLNESSQVPGFREVLSGEVQIPGTDETLPAKFPGGPLANDAHRSRRQQLADWLTRSDNPFFAKAAVNRVWFLLFGRGLIDPPDDMSKPNASMHDDVLNELAQAFQEHNLRSPLVSPNIVPDSGLSAGLYRAGGFGASRPVRRNECKGHDGRATIRLRECRRLSAAGQWFGWTDLRTEPRDRSRTPVVLGILSIADHRCHRLPHGDQSGPHTDERTHDRCRHKPHGQCPSGGLRVPFLSDEDRVDALFLAVLAWQPRDEERAMVREQIARGSTQDDVYQIYSDLLWALLNCSEFVLIR